MNATTSTSGPINRDEISPERLAKMWERRPPPVRPSPDTVSIYADWITRRSSGDPGAILVLGATPEIRNLCGQHELPILCIDHSPSMHEAMSLLVDSSPCEIYLDTDWLDVQLPETAGLVLGDGALTFLQPDEQTQFLKSLHRMLRPGGRAVLRALVKRPKRFESPEEVMNWYRSDSDDEPLYTATVKHLDSLYLKEDRYGGSALQWEYVPELFEAGILTKDEFETFTTLNKPSSNYITYADPNRLENTMETLFEIEDKRVASDYSSARFTPIYVLRKS